MASPADPWQIPVRIAGQTALQGLENATSGRIAALFERSFYLSTDTGLVCIGDETLYPGPLNLITAAPAGTNWRASGLCLHAPVRFSTNRFSVGHQMSFSLEDLQPWKAAPGPDTPVALTVARGLSGFRATARSQVRTEGLGGFIFKDEPDNSPCCRTASRPIANLNAGLHDVFRTRRPYAPDWFDIRTIAGLGPGLTPAGDDFLGGMMIALQALKEPSLCSSLWAVVEPCVAAAENAISHAHLKAASQGNGAAAIHDLLHAILAGDTGGVRRHIVEMDGLGHSSGWDTMAGVVTVLDAWQHENYPSLQWNRGFLWY